MTAKKPITLTDGVAAGGSQRTGLEVIRGMIDGGMTSTMATTMDTTTAMPTTPTATMPRTACPRARAR